eukprot:2911021-Amphidinium_carterae.2
MLRKAKLDILVFSTSGLKPTELPGPSSFDAWDSSYNVLKSAMVRLDAVTLGHFEAYRTHIKDYSMRHPSDWATIYLASLGADLS